MTDTTTPAHADPCPGCEVCELARQLAQERAEHDEHRRWLALLLDLPATADWLTVVRVATELAQKRPADAIWVRAWGEEITAANQRAQAAEAERAALAATLAELEARDTPTWRARAETAEATVRDYENRITWETNCGEHARLLDACRVAEEERDRAVDALARVRELRDRWAKALGTDRTYAHALNTALDGPMDPVHILGVLADSEDDEPAEAQLAAYTTPVGPRDHDEPPDDDHPVHDLYAALAQHHRGDIAESLIKRYYDAITSGPAAEPEPVVCNDYQLPATATDSGLCTRCGMYDYKHTAPDGAATEVHVHVTPAQVRAAVRQIMREDHTRGVTR